MLRRAIFPHPCLPPPSVAILVGSAPFTSPVRVFIDQSVSRLRVRSQGRDGASAHIQQLYVDEQGLVDEALVAQHKVQGPLTCAGEGAWEG